MFKTLSQLPGDSVLWAHGCMQGVTYPRTLYRVDQLYRAVSELVGDWSVSQLVLLTPDGRQLDGGNTIASYAAGTVGVPVCG